MPSSRFSSKLEVIARLFLIITIVFAVCLFAFGAQGGDVFNGVSLSVDSPTVPAGGLLQMQVFITEPKPILKGKQGTRAVASANSAFADFAASASTLGAFRDAALFSTGTDVSGVAVTSSTGTEFYFSSPLNTFGMSVDTPVMTVSYPVLSTAKAGQALDLTLDPTQSQWLDPTGKAYATELKSGTMTVGGTVSISDVTPGDGTVAAGSTITIKGVGFQATSKVDFGEGHVQTQQFINSNQIQITLRDALNVRGQRIRVENGNERATYFPFQRTTAIGNSTHKLMSESYPLFPQTALKLGYFKSTLKGKQFTGIALQNLNSTQVPVTLQLLSSSGVVLSEQIVNMGKNTRYIRDLAEVFPGVKAATGTEVEVTATKGVQILGLLGDDSAASVSPITVTTTP
jgi:hypothetical protein